MAAVWGLVTSNEDPVTCIRTDAPPQPAGHCAQATVAGGCIYVSAQLWIRLDARPRSPSSAAIDQPMLDEERHAMPNTVAAKEERAIRL